MPQYVGWAVARRQASWQRVQIDLQLTHCHGVPRVRGGRSLPFEGQFARLREVPGPNPAANHQSGLPQCRQHRD